MQKAVIRNEHRESFKAGKFDEIPEYSLKALREEEAKAKEAKKEAKKEEK